MRNHYLKTWCQVALVFCLLAWALPALAQKKVSGKVTDSENNDGLPGVAVQVKGSSKGTITDVEGGKYEIQAETGATLVFSSVGFISQEVVVGSSATINVALVSDVKTLNEIVVTGYGSQAKRDVTGAVATVDSKQLLAVPAANVGQAMQGRIAGVN
nr:carboxypeptidase-like regulatory domain-containing protein [Bernardetiaceae bacterium]